MASLSNDEQSQQQNRPVYTNWFNSLRRHKQKKPTASSATKEAAALQRSCIDLSKSVFYLKDVDSDLAGTSSTTNIYVDEENVRKRAGTISKLCSPCCGSQQSALDLIDAQKLPAKYEDLSTQTNAPSVDNNQYEIKRTEQPLKDNMVTLVSKRADFLRTTTVTTTHTIVISRPIEVLLNKNGEIVAKKAAPQHYLKHRTNSLDCMLEEQGSAVIGVRQGVLVSCDDLQFIDENNSNNNNNNFHAYNEKCHLVSQVEPTIDTNEKWSKETTQIENLHSNDIANNERNKFVDDSAVIMNNYKKVG